MKNQVKDPRRQSAAVHRPEQPQTKAVLIRDGLWCCAVRVFADFLEECVSTYSKKRRS